MKRRRAMAPHVGCRFLLAVYFLCVLTGQLQAQAPAWPRSLLPLHGEGMVFDPSRKRLILFGGSATTDGGTVWTEPAETWAWTDGWSVVSPAGAGPGPRAAHATGYDPGTGRVVLYGGARFGAPGERRRTLCDTWFFDGRLWTEARSASCVSTRLGATLAYDAARQFLLLIEGSAPASRPMEHGTRIWRWQDSNWVLMDSVGPRREAGEYAAFDEARSVLVLPVNRGPDAGVWEWDGRGWSRRDAAGPVGRTSYGLTYDPNRQRVLLVGGEVERSGGRSVHNDVWSWDGVQWSELRTEGRLPAPRAYGLLVPNPITGALFYFGGASESGIIFQELWELDRNGRWRLLGEPARSGLLIPPINAAAARWTRAATWARRSR